MLYADQKTYMVELLMKQDQMSMACSIESRVPFLDHPFVEFAARVPDHLKIRNGVGKYIIKEAVADLLPAELLHRPKMGFPTPLRPWLLEPGARHLIDSLTDSGGLLACAGRLDREAHAAPGRRDGPLVAIAESANVGRSFRHRKARPLDDRI
jgi:asparagine synthase (glutamine-hydrolysing)